MPHAVGFEDVRSRSSRLSRRNRSIASVSGFLPSSHSVRRANTPQGISYPLCITYTSSHPSPVFGAVCQLHVMVLASSVSLQSPAVFEPSCPSCSVDIVLASAIFHDSLPDALPSMYEGASLPSWPL